MSQYYSDTNGIGTEHFVYRANAYG